MSEQTGHWTCVADEVWGLEGQGLVFAAPQDRDRVVSALTAVGYALAEVDGAGIRDFRDAQARIATVLRLPDAAARNLDAMADGLRDLSGWPDTPRLALLWDAAEELVSVDLRGWFRLTDVLCEASENLWRGGGDPEDRLFETVLFVRGYGVSEPS